MGDPANRPLLAAKDELLRSLAMLDSLHQFFLVFYNEEPRVFNAAGCAVGWFLPPTKTKTAHVPSSTVSKPKAARNITRRVLIAVRLRPDVIFLLTDGEQKDDLTGEQLAHLKRLNEAIAQIHVIQFAGSPYANNSLVELARQNRGRHTFVDIRNIAAAAP